MTREGLFDFVLLVISFGLFGLYAIFKVIGLFPEYVMMFSGFIELFDLLIATVLGASFYSLLKKLEPRFCKWVDK